MQGLQLRDELIRKRLLQKSLISKECFLWKERVEEYAQDSDQQILEDLYSKNSEFKEYIDNIHYHTEPEHKNSSKKRIIHDNSWL